METDFSSMLNPGGVPCDENANGCDTYSCEVESLDEEISIDEVYKAITLCKSGKSPGVDDIPVELYKNQTAMSVLCNLFNICFNTGKVPQMWNKGIITPIPKSSTCDMRETLSFRGITLAPSSYKLYCSILNARLSTWLDDRNIIHDEQNGFRPSRSTLDHLSTISNIIEGRKLRRQSTFAAFIDFKKAYDTVDRNLLFCKLESIGISSKRLNAV